MRAGSLRHRVDLEAPVRVKDGAGGHVVSWQPVAREIAASVEPLSTFQRLQSMRDQAAVTHEVRLRYREDVRPGMRVMHRGRALYIEGAPVDVKERRRELLLLCREEALA